MKWFLCMHVNERRHSILYTSPFLSLSLRFLTLLPPIKLKFQVGFTSAPPTSPPPSFIAVILANPNTIRVVFVITMATIVVGYSFLLVHHSRDRHKKYIQSWKMRNPFNKVACLKGHTQVSEAIVTWLLELVLILHTNMALGIYMCLYYPHWKIMNVP